MSKVLKACNELRPPEIVGTYIKDLDIKFYHALNSLEVTGIFFRQKKSSQKLSFTCTFAGFLDVLEMSWGFFSTIPGDNIEGVTHPESL